MSESSYGDWEGVIGLEIHAQLKTRSKMFCGCPTTFGAPPNTQVCPVCLGLPGVLPVGNRRAIEFTITMGLAAGSTIASHSVFARKNYYYPDMPKNYQISQYELPLCTGGAVPIDLDGETRTIGLVRVHLEEDVGKLTHEGALETAAWSHVDFNRAGVPLMEIVSQPELRTPEEAGAYLKELRSILRYLDISDGNMEEGSFRCDANVSVRRRGETALGVKAEVKNMNSFRFVQRALEYEIHRQIRVLERGGRIVQETRLFNADKGITLSSRTKEYAQDYRYFPDPDLVPIEIDPAWVERLRNQLVELPSVKRARFIEQYGLPAYDAGVLVSSQELAAYFEELAHKSGNPKASSNWVMGDLLGSLNKAGIDLAQCPVRATQLADMITLIDKGMISGKIAKAVFEEMFSTGEDPQSIVRRRGLTQVSDEAALTEVVERVLAENPEQVGHYRAGKTKLMGFFVGQVMKATQGKANPALVNELLSARLGGQE